MTERAIANNDLPATWRPPTLPEGWHIRAVSFTDQWPVPWLTIELERHYPLAPARASLTFRQPDECMKQLDALAAIAPPVPAETLRGIGCELSIYMEPDRRPW